MNKTLAAAGATVALLAGSVAFAPTAGAAPAHNSTPGCVTKSEYKKAKKGMTKAKVTKIFGTAGKREARASSGGYVTELRSYKACSRYSAIAISFDKNPGGTLRLTAKDAVWVS